MSGAGGKMYSILSLQDDLLASGNLNITEWHWLGTFFFFQNTFLVVNLQGKVQSDTCELSRFILNANAWSDQ